MKMEISNKDRRLLVFLFSVLIAVCFVSFGIRPVLTDYIEYREKYEDELSINQENSLKIKLFDSEKELFDRLESKMAEEKSFFYPAMTNYEIDDLISTMAKERGIVIRELKLKSIMDNITSTSETKINDEIGYVDLMLQLMGTRSKIMDFVDDINKNCPSICISSYSFLNEEQEDLWNFEIMMRIYMQK